MENLIQQNLKKKKENLEEIQDKASSSTNLLFFLIIFAQNFPFVQFIQFNLRPFCSFLNSLICLHRKTLQYFVRVM